MIVPNIIHRLYRHKKRSIKKTKAGIKMCRYKIFFLAEKREKFSYLLVDYM
jgi:hypothetical protein